MSATLSADTRDSSCSPRAESLDLAVDRAALKAGARIAPLWPLESFVAVNPLMGMAERDLGAAGHLLAHTCGARDRSNSR